MLTVGQSHLMELSCKLRYALLALLELANHYEQGEFLQVDQIAAEYQLPDRYLAHLLMALRRCGLVRSQRGARGGYALAREPGQITVLEVLACLEGVLNQKSEDQANSPNIETFVIEEVWQEANGAAMAVFGRYTLQDLHDKRDEGQQHLKPMYYI